MGILLKEKSNSISGSFFKFLSDLIFISLIVALFIAMPFYILYVSGEIRDINYLIKKQRIGKQVLGLAYSDPIGYYKLQNVKIRKPEIIALGSSRVMQFRSFFFNDQSFYNAGGSVQSMYGYNLFLKKMNHYPKVIIIGLDQMWFNQQFHNTSGSVDLTDNFSNFEIFKSSFNKVIVDLLLNKIDIKKISNTSQYLGLTAMMKQNGFRYDGSYIYSREILNPIKAEDYLFKDTYDRIDKGERRFEYGTLIDQSSLIELNLFLNFCKSKNIHVIAFLPPFAPSVWEKLRQKRGEYSYLFSLYPLLEKTFSKYSYQCFDFSNISSLGSNDPEFINGFHGSEKAYLRILIEMCKRDSSLLKYCDMEALSNLLKKSYSANEVIREVIPTP